MKTIFFLGDSLTEGTLSYDWVSNFKKTLPTFDLINKARNGLTTCTLYHYLIKEYLPYLQDPDYVVLMIGGNDVIGSTDEACGIFYMDIYPKIQIEPPSLENFERDLKKIINELDTELPLKTHIIVLSPPPIGEGGKNSEQWKLGYKFNKICSDLVKNASHRVIYKDLFNDVLIDMENHIKKKTIQFKLSISAMYLASFLSYIFSWETIRWIIGFNYTTDGVHFCKEFGDKCEKTILEEIVRIEESDSIKE